MWWEIAASIATIITSISLVATIIQLFREKRHTNTESFFYLHKYLSQEQFNVARKKVRTELYKKKYSRWTDEDKENANRVCASYDQAGILIQTKVVHPKVAKSFLMSSWGQSIVDQYKSLSPFLDKKQTPSKTGREFFSHFTWLYNEAKKYH